jgi:hypothetical protein
MAEKCPPEGNLCSDKKINPGDAALHGYASKPGSKQNPSGDKLGSMRSHKGGRFDSNSASSVKGKK